MRFLTFLHSKENVSELVERAKEDDIEFVLCLLDCSTDVRPTLKKLDSIQKKVYLIPCFMKQEPNLTKYTNLVSLHTRAIEIDDYVFLGYGGAALGQEDSQFRKIAREWYSQYQSRKIVLALHAPPYGTKLDWLEDRYVGSFDYRKFIERIHPKVAIVGHIHVNNGVTQKVGGSKVINPGFEGMVVELK